MSLLAWVRYLGTLSGYLCMGREKYIEVGDG